MLLYKRKENLGNIGHMKVENLGKKITMGRRFKILNEKQKL